ncbi:methyltransferase domain-containing protein [endosymbiont of Acanthamoeba sp. UWC8]|uniref:class I SAM-dependent methyltransferase n=1 Tax=endosymbiont of Acanthamoeba sp. UWC8 TaxID=86106 RepID=UPI0004D16C8F|nr:class I SAM-dependent methyltransferase [endosymbiont of Acanthamoeba sp. UWC8]AIF81663.1 methyltransferase domain-containing protein [endosymbiont of Acanthamoeba sp. UWC8]
MNRAHNLKHNNHKYKKLELTCNLCNSSDHELITSKDYENYKSFKVLCRECGLIYSNPVPTLEGLELYYEQKSERYSGEIFIPKLRRIYRSALRAIYRYNRIKHYLKKGINVLDSSACIGEFVYLLEQKGSNAIGVEHNNYLIQYARNELKINIERHFLDNIKMPKETFNIITAYHILNLCLNPLEVLKKYWSFLKDDGILNLEVPNIDARHIAPYHRFRFKYFYNFNLHTIKMLARRAGFEVVNTIIIPKSMHINMILKKGEPYQDEVSDAQNYMMVRNSIIGYKSLNFLVSPLPYLKAMDNIKKYMVLNKAVKEYSSGKEILDDCFAKIPEFK